MIIVSPSLLSADLGRLRDEVELLESSGVPWVHWDSMDGRYVPNITFGGSVIGAVKPYTKSIVFDVHLMIEEPERHIDSFIEAGANVLVIHTDSTRHPQRLLSYIRSCGIMAGVALNPHEHPNKIEYLLPDVDIVLVMSVNPGFSGQSFIPQTIDKIEVLRSMIEELSLPIKIQVDGGVSVDNIGLLYKKGVDIVVSGSSFFKNTEKTQVGYSKQLEKFIVASEKEERIV